MGHDYAVLKEEYLLPGTQPVSQGEDTPPSKRPNHGPSTVPHSDAFIPDMSGNDFQVTINYYSLVGLGSFNKN